jgi:hypothetical protein
MRRIQLVVAVAAMMVAMLSFSVPAMADVDFDDLYEDGVLLYYDIDDNDDIDDIDDLDDIDDIDDLDREGPVHLID